MPDKDDQIKYSKREHAARIVLQSFGFVLPAGVSLIDESTRISDRNPRAVAAVMVADKIIAIIQSKRRTWPRDFLPT